MIKSNAQLTILLTIHAIRKDILVPFAVPSKSMKCLKRQHNTAFRNHADAMFLGIVNMTYITKPWIIDINVNKSATICFKLNTGADVSVISSDDYTHLGCKLSKSDKALYTPDNTCLDALEVFSLAL